MQNIYWIQVNLVSLLVSLFQTRSFNTDKHQGNMDSENQFDGLFARIREVSDLFVKLLI